MSFHHYDSYTFWISRLTNSLQERLNRDLETLDLTGSQWTVMSILSTGDGCSPATIAEKMQIDRSAASRLADRLEKKGLVSRQVDEKDRRSVRVVISEPGEMMISYMNQAVEKHQQQILDSLSDSEAETFKRLLKKLLQAEGIDSSEW